MTTTVSTTMCPCNWCKTWIDRGVMAYNTNSNTFEKKIKELSTRISTAKGLPIGPSLVIHSFLAHKTDDIKTYCLDCATFDIKFSTSGRIIKAPMRLGDESFVKGSGHGHCDQYDRGYDSGLFRDTEKEDCSDLNNFIVDDDEIILDDVSEYSSEEEEWNEDSSSDEEEWSETD